MILFLLVISNIALAVVLIGAEFRLADALVALCSITAVLDVVTPHNHPLRKTKALPVVVLVAIVSFSPLPSCDHEIVMRPIPRQDHFIGSGNPPR